MALYKFDFMLCFMYVMSLINFA